MTDLSPWSGGYVAEVPYTYGVYRELSPTIHNYALALKAYALGATATEKFNYCELGCGQGVSVAMLAAANPDANFYATDFNPSHALHGRLLATQGGLSNMHFFDSSFEEMLNQDLPEMDCIALHGVYSWISPEARRGIVTFIRKKLKVGGSLYISYNTLPGWAPVMPLREMMVAQAAGSGAPLVQRIEDAMAFAAKLEAMGAKYFAANPNIKARLDLLPGMPRNYLAHEYFNRDWHPMYFREVARELSEAKVDFAASAHLHDHVDAINVTPDQLALLQETPDPWSRETLRDFMTNQQFRKDIYIRGGVKLGTLDQLEQLMSMRFVLNQLPSDTPRTVTGQLGEAALHAEIYDPILTALGTGPMTLKSLIEQPGVQGRDFASLLQALTILIGGGLLNAAPDLGPKVDERRKRSTERFNRAIMQRAVASSDIGNLASPVACSGVAVDRFEQMFLLAHSAKTPDPAGFVWGQLKKIGQRMIRDGKILETEAENLAELNEKIKVFTNRRLPVLKHLGLV